MGTMDCLDHWVVEHAHACDAKMSVLLLAREYGMAYEVLRRI
jgi:hypothetical protein